MSLMLTYIKILCWVWFFLPSVSRDWPRNMKICVDKSKTLFKREPEALVHIFSKKHVPTDTVFVPNPHPDVVPPTVAEGPNFANASSSNSSFNIIHELNYKGSITFITVTSVSSCPLLFGMGLDIINLCHKAQSYDLE